MLGWLDTLLLLWAYTVLGAALAAVALQALLRGTAGRSGLWLLGCALACVPLTFAAMLLTWTPLPAVRIEGVQGRYFIAPAPLAAAALAPVSRPRWPWRAAAGRAAWALAAAGAAAGVVALWLALSARYH